MKRVQLVAIALVLACCNANDVVLYRSAGTAAGAGDAMGEGDVGNTGATETGGTQASGGGTDATGGTSATGGSDTAGGTDATGGNSNAAGGTDASGGSGNASGGDTDDLKSCTSNKDCHGSQYCSKSTCADEVGTCLPSPVDCDTEMAPVCGCDNVTYWNSCLRQGYGVAAERAHQCDEGPTCLSDDDCGDPGFIACAHLLRPGEMDCADRGGTCWVTPLECESSDMDPPHWLPCGAPPPSMDNPTDGGLACVSTCVAIQSGEVYVPAPRFACPP